MSEVFFRRISNFSRWAPPPTALFFVVLGLLATLQTASATTYWVAPPPTGNNANAGTQAAPFATITYAMTKALQPGDIVNVTTGTYRNEKIEFKASGTSGNPITLQSAPGASVTIKGSTTVSAWTLNDPASQGRPIYAATWTRYFGAWDSRFTSNPQGSISTLGAGSMARNQFFVNGAYVPEVPRLIDLAPNTFFIDDAANIVYLWLSDGSSPTGKLVEGTNTQDALIATRAKDHIVIRGFTVEHCANTGSLNAMIRADATGSPSNDWSHHLLIENITARYAAATAIGLWNCNPATVRNCVLTDNGQSGLLTAGVKNTLISGGQWLRNNTLAPKYYNHGVEAVHKVASCEDTIIENIESAYNRGFGMWVDGPKNRRITFRNNLIHHNGVPGAFTQGLRIEISYLVDVYNNVIYRNDSGISLDTSIGCRVFNNTIAYNNSEGIYCAGVRNQWDDIRVDAVMRNYGNQLFNNLLSNNQQGSNKRGYIVSYNVPDPLFNPPEFPNSDGVVPFAQNQSNNNLFFRGTGDTKFFVLHTDSPWANTNYTSLTAWQNASSGQGWDTASKWAQNPLFIGAASDNYRIPSTSPAATGGVLFPGYPSAALVDFLGRPRTASNIAIGAYQPAPPAAPTGFSATTNGTSVSLAWNTVADATTYSVKRAASSGGSYTTIATGLLIQNYIDANAEPGAWAYYVVTASNLVGEGASSSEASALPLNALQSWRQTYFNQTAALDLAANDSDPDGDGVPNLVEYALATNPLVPSSAPSVSLDASSPPVLSLAFIRARADLTYVVEGSSDLVDWSPLATNPGTVGQNVTVTDLPDFPATGPARRFLRLRILTP